MTMLMNTLGATVGTQIARPFIADEYGVPTVDTTLNSTITEQTVDEAGGLEPVQVIYLIVGALDVGMAAVCMLTCVWLSSRGGRCCSVDALFKDAEDDDDDDIQLIPDSSSDDQPSDRQTASDSSNTPLVSSDDQLHRQTARGRAHTAPVSSDDRSSDTGQQTPAVSDEKVQPCSRHGRILLALIFVFHFVTDSRNFSFNFLLFTYVYEYRGWSADAGTTLLLVGKLLHFVVGALMVPVSRWVRPTPLLVYDLAMLTTAGVLMIASLRLGDAFVVAGVIFEAFGTSDHGTVITLLEETIHVIAPLMATFVAISGVSAITGFVVGTLLFYVGESAYAALVLTATLLCTALFVAYKVLSIRFMDAIERAHKSNRGETDRPH